MVQEKGERMVVVGETEGWGKGRRLIPGDRGEGGGGKKERKGGEVKRREKERDKY